MFAEGTEVKYMGTDSSLIGKTGIVVGPSILSAGYTRVRWVGGLYRIVANQCLMEVSKPRLKDGDKVRYVGDIHSYMGRTGMVKGKEKGMVRVSWGDGYTALIAEKNLEKLQKQPTSGETAEQPKVTAPTQKDMVHSPSHYALFDDLEAIDVIARSMTVEMFKGYCLGNLLKYRLRAGKKDSVAQDLAKADKYNEIFEKHKGQCRDAS